MCRKILTNNILGHNYLFLELNNGILMVAIEFKRKNEDVYEGIGILKR